MIEGDLRAIIDIGSNSVRLVVYGAPRRAPAILFNEKVMCGLGAGLGAGASGGGRLDSLARERALRALARFHAIATAMRVSSLRVVATAAVRDASDGASFIADAAEMGIAIDLLSGAEEGDAAGLGVIAGIPNADGIVGDMGGGSLELVRVRRGKVRSSVSLPLGVLRVAEIRAGKRRALETRVAKLIAKSGWSADPGLPFYMVGGSWRSLARLHMTLTDWPLPILHQYEMSVRDLDRTARALAASGKRRMVYPGVSSARLPALGDAAALLKVLAKQLSLKTLIVSATGLREGLLYGALDAEARREDPLLAAARSVGARLGRFAEHGDLIEAWIAPLFPDDSAEDQRLRRAACLLGDVAWATNPEFRAAQALETGLHGNWTGVDARGRAMIAMALFACFRGDGMPDIIARLLSAGEQQQALRWGLAMRLGQRLSGGVAGPLAQSSLSLGAKKLTLTLDPAARDLYGDAVERRHRQLASAFGVQPAVA